MTTMLRSFVLLVIALGILAYLATEPLRSAVSTLSTVLTVTR